MLRSRQYITALLDGIPLEEFPAFEHRTAFEQIKEHLIGADDLVGELKTLYRVNNFSDFALSLLWIAEKVERDPSALEWTPDEQTLVVSSFRKAVGEEGGVSSPAFEPVTEVPPALGSEQTAESPFDFPLQPELSPEAPAFPSEPAAETLVGPEPMAEFPAAETPSESMAEFPSVPAEEFPSAESAPMLETPAAAPSGEGSPEVQFAQLVEQFVEAVQTGAENRDAIKDQLLSACQAVLVEGSGAADDYRNFCQVLTEFVSYIMENQLVDDIRVMNLLSNVTDPVWAWARADEAGRAGLLDAAYDVLRDYKSLFE
jgi:hypothetical protein